jgi:membrane protease YdiL (CAAX protease family)
LFIFGQDKNSMSLQPRTAPAIGQGWLRAVILLIVYVSASVGAGFFISSFEIWVGISLIIAIGLVYLFRKYIDKKSFEGIGLDFSKCYPDAVIGAFLGIFLVSAGALLIFYFRGIEWIDIVANTRELFTSAVLLLMVAFSEEIVFRGYVLRNLMKSFNKWVALLISSTLFTLVHVSNPDVPWTGLLNTFIGGLLIGITYINTRSLWLPISFHFTWNFMQGPLVGFSVSGISFRSLFLLETKGNPLLSGGNYGFEGSLLASFLLLEALSFCSYFERKRSVPVY